MVGRLWKLFGMADESGPDGEYDPVYGLPRRAVEEWLAHNPRFREQYEVNEWLARNPPLRAEYEAEVRQSMSALRGGDRQFQDKTSLRPQSGDNLSRSPRDPGQPPGS
jgi:hypothetical protein